MQYSIVSTPSCLEEFETLLANAQVCALDCEWPPHARQRCASLVSLALWSAAHGVRVLLLDVQELPPATTRQALGGLLRRQSCLKVGFQMLTDLRVLVDSIGCATVACPCIDVGVLHSRLIAAGTPGVAAAGGRGLGAICLAQLGVVLDKSQQTSAWGVRPLSEQQLRYSAMDAACLLLLLDAYLQRLDPADHPCSDAEASGWRVELPGRADSSAACTQQPATESDAGLRAAAPGTAERALSRLELSALTPERVQNAARHWGRRLDVNAAPPPSGPRAARRLQEASLPGGGFPLHVPWMNSGSREGTERRPAFLGDVMAQGLVRQLRLLGIDAEDLPCAPKDQRHAVQRLLVERAQSEGRVILTLDRQFVARNLSDSAYLVRSQNKHEQAAEVVAAFGIQVAAEDLLSRCPKCNGAFIPKPLRADQLPAGHGVPSNVLQRFGSATGEGDEGFWVCSRCQSVFWQGCQYARAMERLTALVTTLQAPAPLVPAGIPAT